MGWKFKEWMLVGMLLAVMTASATAQIATTSVTDTVYRADGTAASGTVIVSWQAFTTALGQAVPSGSTSAVISSSGAMSVALVPNAGATPMGSYYTAVYHLDDGTLSREFWVIPANQAPVQVSAVKSTVLPTSVAMQTESKSYVDTAIATAVAGHPLDSTNPYVLKSGDTLTGPLTLPGDPVSTTQAADKHYVDLSIAGVAGGLGQKISQLPFGSQTIAQPAGTQMGVNHLNGVEYASQYVSGLGNNGIANAVTGADCASGCDVNIESGYNSVESYNPAAWNSTGSGGTHVEDRRDGGRRDSYLNPMSPLAPGQGAGQSVDVVSTRSAASVYQNSGAEEAGSFGMAITHEALAGGSNLFPATIESVPYFKSNYGALFMKGTYNTLGQHNLAPKEIDCYGVGDCLIGSEFLIASGGFRDEADEGAHPMDLQIEEDTRVFQGTCSSGCASGSTTVMVAATSAPGTQGEGRYLIDKNPASVLTTGLLTGGTSTVNGTPGATASFSGTSFPVSVFFSTAQTIPSQANNIAPGTVTVAIATSGVTAGFATNTAAALNPSGVACVADQPNSSNPHNYEMANYTVVDGTHLLMTLNKVHRAGATIAIGGLCGYGLEQTVDTARGIRQVFPVIGSYSSTGLYYGGGLTAFVGISGQTSGYLNVNLQVASIARSSNVVTVTTASNLPVDVNGLTMTVAGVTDSSYNGSYVVTTTGPNTLTYSDTGANSTSTGGTVAMLTGGYVLYPMAEVLGVFDAAAKSVDGQMTLAPNTVQWAANDPLEEPHYYQEKVAADTTAVAQTIPRPGVVVSAGIQYQLSAGPGLKGWIIGNAVPASNYLGNGGTHSVPFAAYTSAGIWQTTMDAQAGDQSVFSIHCNSHGCGRWNSNYNLFQLDSNVSVDTISFQPVTSALTMNLRGTSYGFTPQGFTAATVNATTVNATTLNGALPAGSITSGTVSVARLPVMGASGSGHGAGVAPDPGPVAGSTHFLREDGTWAVPVGSVPSLPAPVNLPQRASLLGEYLLNEGSGAVADDTSGLGNNATISGAAWEGKTDLNFAATGEYIQLPTALNATRTWQFAIYSPPFGWAAQPLAPGYGDVTAFGINPSILCGTDAQHLCLMAGGHGKSLDFKAYTTDSTEAAEPLTAGWHIVSLLCGSNVAGVVTKTHILYDGAEVGSYVNQGDSNTCPNPTTGNYQIGGSSVFTGSWFIGKVAAAWAWSTPLSLGDGAAAAKSALDYIRAKGVATDFRKPVNVSPMVIGGLDSRTYGVQLMPTTTWLATLSLTDPSYTKLNLGVSGMVVYDACAMFDLMYGQQIAGSSGPVITVLWGGVNDITYGSPTRLTANGLKCMVQKAKALGSKVVLATEISSESNRGVTGDAGKNALNAMIRAEAYGWGVDNIADLATDPHIGADGASSNTACFPDNLHPGPGCEPYVTAVMSDAINELLGSTESNRHATAATTYQETAGDRFLDMTGTAAQAVSLPDCIGYSLSRQVVNLGSVAGTIAAINGETLTGSGSIAVGARAVFVPVPGAPATGGCRWERTQ
ncbi:MAG: GDSL-type esterase/lipase family protein [Edaphobacter sp.]